MELTLGLIGFGNAGRAFLRLLLAKRRELFQRYRLSFRITGISTKSHGSAIDPAGIDCRRALRRVEAGQSIADQHVGLPVSDAMDFIRRRPAKIVFEITTLNPWSGLPALDHIRLALQKGLHVVTANKGPVAVAYRELSQLAGEKKRAFRFEGTVLDGVPVFSLVEKTLLGTQIDGFHGILNSTCNLVLSEMERGKSRESALKKARRMGVAEADPTHDIEGWDTVAKTAVLANVLMDADIQPTDVTRMGIGAVRPQDVKRALEQDKVLRLIGRAVRKGQKVRARVAPELLDPDDPMSTASGTTNALAIHTDTLKELILFERNPGIEQTAYALLSDLLIIASGGYRW
jgi:homoserine dehydrogenase